MGAFGSRGRGTHLGEFVPNFDQRYSCPLGLPISTPLNTVAPVLLSTASPACLPPNALATFRRKKPFLDDRATDLGAQTRRQIAAAKV
jgi:hypothetical protein